MNNENELPIYHPSRENGSRESSWSSYFRRQIRNRLSRRMSTELDDLKVALRPCSAYEFFNQDETVLLDGWNPTLKAFLAGTRSNDALVPLSLLRDHEQTIVRQIFSFMTPFAKHVRMTIPAGLVGNGYNNYFMKFVKGRTQEGRFQREMQKTKELTSDSTNGYVSFVSCGRVEFPSPANRNVNMLPFVLGNKESLPEDLQCYYPLIDMCPYMKEEEGKVAYLTVHESHVDVGKAQRREGLHIESPGFFNDDLKATFTPGEEHPWGQGVFFGPDRMEGGIYFASSVANSSEVWDALVDKNVPGIVDRLGGCEHLRPLLGKGTKLEAGELVWMTDCTPHEALPQTESGTRQFFRLVMPYIKHWYAKHSTPNPKVKLPDSVKIIQGNKFEAFRAVKALK